MMRLPLLLVLLIVVFSASSQGRVVRVDTTSMSLNFTYALIAYSAGVEIPIHNYSIAASANYNVMFDQGFYAGASLDRNIMLELRRYLKPKYERQSFLGVFSRYRFMDHVAPDEGEYDDDWFESEQLDVGLMFGKRKYITGKLSIEGYLGGFIGWRDGIKRTDITDTGQEVYQEAKDEREGLMFKFKFSYELFKKRK